MITILPILLAVPLYLLAAVLLLLRLTRRVSLEKFSRARVLGIAFLAMMLHLVILHQHLFTPLGVNLNFFNVVSLLTWLLALVLLLSTIGQPVDNLGIAVFPLAAIGMVLEKLFPSEALLLIGQPMLDVHVLISVAAYSVLTLAALQAVLLAVQDRHLRTKHPGGFVRALPPLQSMERLLFQFIGVGFVLQTVSLLTGFLFLENMFAQHLVHKTVFSVAAWLVFAVLLWGRWRFGWRGRIAIRSTLAGAICLLLAYLGSKLVLELLIGHQ
jgi:ABC-type uncharacterized transport system permease subunit